jgi:hypothetical protein
MMTTMIKHFGPGQVFKDIDSLTLGDAFVDVIREKLQRAFVTGGNFHWACRTMPSVPRGVPRERPATACHAKKEGL